MSEQPTTRRSGSGTKQSRGAASAEEVEAIGPAAAAVERVASVQEPRSQLVGEYGRTTIARSVVATIAGIAAREVEGVHRLGGGTSRVAGAVRNRIPGSSTNHAQGISVEVGERQAAVDVELVAEYGVPLADLATGLRNNVIATLERMTGLEVTEVNVDILDIDVPDLEDVEKNRRQLQ